MVALTDTANSHRRHRIALLALILLALGLRLFRLTYQPLWWDEGWSLYFAMTDVGAMLDLTAVDIHPPLYYLLLHLWTGLLGSSVFSVRLLSVLIGTATLPLIYVTGRRLSGPAAGLLAAFFLAISPFHITYSQEVRMYGLVTLFGLAAVYSAWQWGAERGTRRTVAWLGYVLAAAAALYTQYYAAFLLLGLNLILLVRWLRARQPLRRSPLRRILPWLAAQVAVVALFLPWLWHAGGKLFTYVQFKISVEQDPSLGFFAYYGRQLAAFTWGHAEGSLADWWWLGLIPPAILLSCLVLFSLRRFRPEDSDSPPPLNRLWSFVLCRWSTVLLSIALLCGFVVNLVFPFNPPRSERLLLLALPAFLLLCTGGLYLLNKSEVGVCADGFSVRTHPNPQLLRRYGGLLILWRARRSWAVVSALLFVIAALVSLFFFYTVPRYPDDDYRPVAARVQALALPTDAIISVHPWQVGYLYAYIPDDDARPTLVLTPRQVLPREQQLWDNDPSLMAADLQALLDQHGRLWFTDHRAMGRVLETKIERTLAEHAYPTLSEWYGENTVLSLFAGGDPAPQAVTAQFGEWLALEGAALNADPLQAGWGAVTADLVWRLGERPGERYHVGLRLVDGTGRVWAQRDSTPVGGLQHFFEWTLDEPHSDRHGLLVPAGTPPGDYRITLQVYRSKDVAVLPVVFEGGSGGEVTLGSVRIVRPELPPPLEALAFDQPLQAALDDRLQLLGFSFLSNTTRLPGEAVEVDLFWQALADPGEDFLPRLQLVAADGSSVAELTEKPVAGTYPTAWWRTGELVRDPHALPIPATVPEGSYSLVLSLVRAADGLPVETRSGLAALELAQVDVQGREHQFWPSFPGTYQKASFGPSVELIGYDLREVIRAPGSPLEVTLHWYATETPDKNYRAFVHLLDDEDNIVAQHDSPPGGGQFPTLGWLPSEYLTDTHLLQLPLDLPDGVYRLGVGLYDPAPGQRLGERVILDTQIPVQAKGGCNCR